MVEIHERLSALDPVLGGVRGDIFTEETASAVEAFQRSRGLPITGVVDEDTWTRLDEARWRLGDRLLYLTKDYLRGDDVADLQYRLSRLGFDPGRIDGVFGPLLDTALREFQDNCGRLKTGVMDRSTWIELLRVTPTTPSTTLVSDVRDANQWRTARGPLIVWGHGCLADALPRTVTRHVVVAPWSWSASELASDANSRDALVVIATNEVYDLSVLRLHYWAGYRTHSRSGERLASTVMMNLAASNVDLRVEIHGMALPVMRETRMTTIHIEHGPLEPRVCETVATHIHHSIESLFHTVH
ncbi:MAG: peptidoglycan-binding protein [Acidimicrobiaceae bacterium]|nr:peptidoglycan-binding protein [Acidimicrobiaceae bacterium]